MTALTFAKLRSINAIRCNRWHNIKKWSLADWGVAAGGEMGEALNVIKKINRFRDGLPGNKEGIVELHHNLAEEIADTVIYLDLLAEAANIDLAAAIIAKFNKVSERLGMPERLGNDDE